MAGPPHTLRRMAAVPFYGATGKFTWRMGAVVLAAQSVIVFLGALVARTLGAGERSTPRRAHTCWWVPRWRWPASSSRG